MISREEAIERAARKILAADWESTIYHHMWCQSWIFDHGLTRTEVLARVTQIKQELDK